MRRRSGLLTAMAALITTLLVACGPAGDDGAPAATNTTAPVVETAAEAPSGAAIPPDTAPPTAVPSAQPVFEPIDLTAAVGESRPRFSGMSTLSAGPTTPVLIAGLRSADAGHTELHVWTSSDGVTWSDQQVPLPGNVVSVEVAADDSLTVLSGLTSTDGVQGRFLVTSPDRVSWTTVTVPAPVAHDDTPVVSVVDGSVFYLVDNDRTDGQLVVIGGGRTVRYPFPRAADGVDRTPIALAGPPSALVALVHEGPDNAARPVVGYRSTDAGATWSAPIAISGPFDSAAGLVWTGSTYIASGSSRPGPDGARSMAAWSSTDGVGWQSDPIDPADGWNFPGADTTTDAWLGAPTTTGGQVMASASGEDTLHNFAYARTPAGRWTAVRTGRPADNTGSAGDLAIVSAAEDASQSVIVMLTQQAQSVTVQRTAPGSGVVFLRWGDETRVPDVVLDEPSDAGLLLHTRGYTVQVDNEGGWSRTVQTTPFRWSAATGLTTTTWDPPGVEDAYEVDRSTAADGSEVVLWNDYDFDRSLRTVAGSFRTGPDAPWEAISGFDADLDVQFGGMGHGDDGWYVYGSTGLDETQVRMWSSTNGRSWQHQDLTDPDRPHLQTVASCVLADGTPLVVGRSTDAAGVGHPLTVTREAGTWVWTVQDGSAVDELNGCATASGSTVVTAQRGDAAVRFSTVDGRSLILIASPDADAPPSTGRAFDTVGNPEPVDPDYLYRPGLDAVAGGFYSAGYLRTLTYTGFVIWLSVDGSTWRWIPVPNALPGGTFATRAVGTDVVLTLTTSGGPLAWRITGLTQVFA